MKQFSQLLYNWYTKNYRDLPWRSTRNPYLIWISECILQQTRVNQGISYYYRFIEKWPDVNILAAASEQEVLKMWQGLGYYSRARNILATARTIVDKYKSEFPRSANELLQLKGIGKYTAAAIASNAFDEKIAVVDGNVLRFITRLKGIQSPADSSACHKSVQQFVDHAIDADAPGIFNQAMMEFGALHCTPKNPDCNICPFIHDCYAFRHKLTDSLPVKKQKTTIKTRYLNYLILLTEVNKNDCLYLHKRTDNDIWKGLYQFPLIETAQPAEFQHLNQSGDFVKLIGANNYTLVSISHSIRHQLTHQTIFATFYVIKLAEKLKNQHLSLSLVSRDELGQYPLPRLIDRYLQQQGLQNNNT
ncbi:MAG: A/G-specific adenine glycosylase [Bacteroidales bacterium]|nr:A/G-specific adenine glycosylase [Bacteroidales bacterium]